jgi:hypothetical protein
VTNVKHGLLILLVPMAAACVPRGAVPEPVYAPAPLPAPQQQSYQPAPRPPAPMGPATPPPASPGAPALAAWADAPLSPGRWVYQPSPGAGSRALFGPANAPSFQIACNSARLLTLTRSGAGAGALTIRTSSTVRALPAAPTAQGLSAQLAAGDPLMDAIAFSRGRFAVEAPGAPALVIPAWPELARVVEDCRR